MRQLTSSRRLASGPLAYACLVAVALPGLTGCFVNETHSVLVHPVAVNLVFGPQPTDTLPAAAAPIRPVPSYAVSEPVFETALPPTVPHPVPGVRPVTGDCPKPGPGVFPADPATTDVVGMPPAGVQQFRYSGTGVINGARIPVLPTARRTFHVPTTSPDPSNSGIFSFQVDGGLAFQQLDPKEVTGFTVRPRATDVNPVDPGSVPNGSRVGVFPDGVYLTRLDLPNLLVPFHFSSVAGVQLLSLPATNGRRWASSADDPADGTSISFEGGINPNADPAQSGRERLDLCGEVVEAWRVDGTLTVAGAGFATTDTPISIWFLTQYGGWIVAESHVLTNERDSGVFDRSGTAVQGRADHVAPSPLPSPSPSPGHAVETGP